MTTSEEQVTKKIEEPYNSSTNANLGEEEMFPNLYDIWILACVLFALTGMEEDVGKWRNNTKITPEAFTIELKNTHRSSFLKLITYICVQRKMKCPMNVDRIMEFYNRQLDRIMNPQSVCIYQVRCKENEVISMNGAYPQCLGCLFSTPWTTAIKDKPMIEAIADYYCNNAAGSIEKDYCRFSIIALFQYQHYLKKSYSSYEICYHMKCCPEFISDDNDDYF